MACSMGVGLLLLVLEIPRVARIFPSCSDGLSCVWLGVRCLGAERFASAPHFGTAVMRTTPQSGTLRPSH
eukprot:5476002-Alexandrium_andersonii.AAC.1